MSILILIALGLLAWVLKASLFTISMLKSGISTTATIRQIIETNTQINGQSVMKIILGYSTDNNVNLKHQPNARSRENTIQIKSHCASHFKFNQKRQILYSVGDPNKVVVLDLLPKPISLNTQETIKPTSFLIAIKTISLPII